MSSLSNYAESGIAHHIFRSNTFPKPLGLGVGLTLNFPEDGVVTEVANAGGYARVNLGPPSDALFTVMTQQANGSGVIYNESVITFPTCTSTWGVVSGLFIATSSVYGVGDVLMQGGLTVPKTVTTNDVFSVPRSGLAIYFA